MTAPNQFCIIPRAPLRSPTRPAVCGRLRRQLSFLAAASRFLPRRACAATAHNSIQSVGPFATARRHSCSGCAPISAHSDQRTVMERGKAE